MSHWQLTLELLRKIPRGEITVSEVAYRTLQSTAPVDRRIPPSKPGEPMIVFDGQREIQVRAWRGE